MAQAALFSTTPFDRIKFSSPKRVRLSLRHQVELSPSKAEPAVDSSCKSQDDMLVDNCIGHDENISPNCKFTEAKLSPFIDVDVIDRKHDVSALGLPNCGNTCYLNSILQVLRYTPNFLSTLHTLVTSQSWLDQISSDHSEVKEADFFFKLHMLYTTMKKQEDFLYKDSEKDYSSFLLNHMQSFLTSLGEISSSFEEGEQHDAHEFLLTIMSKFDSFCASVKVNATDYCNGSEAPNSTSVSRTSFHRKRRKLNKFRSQLKSRMDESFRNIPNFNLGFEGKMRHTIKCLECERRLERIEPFTNLEVSIADDSMSEETIDLCQCLVQRTLVSGENKYFCEECYHLTEAQLIAEITSLPSILILHCSWLRQSSIISDIEKDDRKVTIPLLLKTSENPDIFQPEADEIYCLYAIVLHIGTSMEKGHYVSFIKEAPKNSELEDYLLLKNNNTSMESCCTSKEILNMKLNSTNNWLLFDDESVSPLCVTETSGFPYYKFMTITASPCIIFYHKM